MLRKYNTDDYIGGWVIYGVSVVIIVFLYALFSDYGLWGGLFCLLVLLAIGFSIYKIYSNIFAHIHTNAEFDADELKIIDDLSFFYIIYNSQKLDSLNSMYMNKKPDCTTHEFEIFFNKLVKINLIYLKGDKIYRTSALRKIDKNAHYSSFYNDYRSKKSWLRYQIIWMENETTIKKEKKVIYSAFVLFIGLMLTLSICEVLVNSRYNYFSKTWFCWLTFSIVQLYIQNKIWSEFFRFKYPIIIKKNVS